MQECYILKLSVYLLYSKYKNINRLKQILHKKLHTTVMSVCLHYSGHFRFTPADARRLLKCVLIFHCIHVQVGGFYLLFCIWLRFVDVGTKLLLYIYIFFFKHYFYYILLTLFVCKHVGHVGKMSVSGHRDRRFKRRLFQYVVSMSRARNPHCFSRLSCEVSTSWGHPGERCLFSDVSFPEK